MAGDGSLSQEADFLKVQKSGLVVKMVGQSYTYRRTHKLQVSWRRDDRLKGIGSHESKILRMYDNIVPHVFMFVKQTYQFPSVLGNYPFHTQTHPLPWGGQWERIFFTKHMTSY